jgi:hypothetical protein
MKKLVNHVGIGRNVFFLWAVPVEVLKNEGSKIQERNVRVLDVFPKRRLIKMPTAWRRWLIVGQIHAVMNGRARKNPFTEEWFWLS